MSLDYGELRIRPARDDEFDRAGHIAARAFSRLRGLLTPDNWAEMEKAIHFVTARDKVGILLVAELAGEIADSVRYTGPGHGGHVIYPDRVAYIRSLAVSLDHPRCGMGRRLTEACIEAAKRDQAAAVGLHVAKANAAANRLYGQLGFRWYRKASDYFGIPYDAYIIRFPSADLREGNGDE